ncbi:DUF7619 domain-containing protein [Xanthocytophaga agilis]|uniref:T9SS type A sorting domain-containing protein n=1 Tax=Xanthocytophaga agilis TaxID=3048010 RepID=A0AAE3UCV2_9BACT|nr:T9SS type A sorting domain-containing protein [Xanthocytophaga agilis]MDJ1501238.1 T9SS type A sorting domain-containing protein [Xanthocytophaga agilis]
MMKTLQVTLLFILVTIVFSVSGWGQEYTFKRTIGKMAIDAPNDIAVDKQGFVYVSSDNGSVVKMDPDGGYYSTIVAANKTSKIYAYTDLIKYIALDAVGNIWVTDGYNNQITKLDALGNVLLKLDSKGNGNGQLNNPGKITLDSEGNVWVINRGNSCIQKFDPTGRFLVRFGSYGDGDGQLHTPTGLAIDSQGNVWVANYGSRCMQKFDPTGKFLLKLTNFIGDNNRVIDPWGVVIDKEDNVWIINQLWNCIQKFDKNGFVISTVISFGSQNDTFYDPRGITIDNHGTVWVADYHYNRIQKFDNIGNFIGNYIYPKSKDGDFISPRGIAVDKQGNTWVVERSNHRIQKFDVEGNFLFSFDPVAPGDYPLHLTNPYGITTDVQGNVWITDIGNWCAKKFDSNGKFLQRIGHVGILIGELYSPGGIAVDPQGNVWITDLTNLTIQKFDSTGKFLLATKYYGDEVQEMPYGITTDRQGNIWVTNYSSNNIKKFDTNGNFLLKVGGITDGKFSYPIGITTDSEDNVWIADSDNYRIQKLDSTGRLLSKIDIPHCMPTELAVSKEGDVYWTNPKAGVFVYSTDQKSYISGKIYADRNQNCGFDNTDAGIPSITVVANPGKYYASTDKLGNYRIPVPVGTYTVSQVLNADKILLQPVCPASNVSESVTVAKEKDQVTGINFANTVIDVPHLEVSVNSDRRRRCFTSMMAVTYSNTGYIAATNVKVYVKLPQYVIFKSANKPYTIDADNNYVFSIDSLKPNQSGSIYIMDSVACVANITGLTQCTKVWITPPNEYTATLPANSQWDKSDIILIGKCVGNGRVQMVIKNIGQSMADSAEFRILLDAQLAFRKNYKLITGDSLVLKIPANGKTIRLEADQRPDHPRKSQSNLTIEGCIASTSDVVSKGLVDILPQDDIEPEVAIQCMPIIDSFDPNDKQVSPAGTANDHYTPTDTELKYTIHFQNTGTDYAYKVVVVDTLSENLDIATLQIGAASHTYSLKVSGKGQPVLTWTFYNINLPDSTRDQAGSNGFIQFSIKPKANLPERTLIENYADIFFDYNDPVRTNTTTNVMYDVPKIINPANQLDDSIIDKVMASEPDALKGKLSLYPNPTQSQVWIQSVDASLRIEQVKIYNLLGELETVSLSATDSQAVQLNMQAKPKGMYLLHIHTNKGTSIQRVVVQ